MGEPEQRHGPLPRSSGSTRTVGSVAEELAAAQGSSQVCCCGARHAWPACWFPPKRLLLMSAALMCPLVFVCCRLLCLQVVLEGDLVNLGVTSPAAALALGLMYLQTNDAAVAAAFQMPGKPAAGLCSCCEKGVRAALHCCLQQSSLNNAATLGSSMPCRHAFCSGLCTTRPAHAAHADAVPRSVWPVILDLYCATPACPVSLYKSLVPCGCLLQSCGTAFSPQRSGLWASCLPCSRCAHCALRLPCFPEWYCPHGACEPWLRVICRLLSNIYLIGLIAGASVQVHVGGGGGCSPCRLRSPHAGGPGWLSLAGQRSLSKHGPSSAPCAYR